MNEAGTRRWWALGALTLAVLAVGLDGTVLSVALPTLAGSLHASESELQWFSSSYLLVLAAAMLPVGFLGDRYGRKKVMLISLAMFGGGSVLCAYSPSANAFIAARVVLGFAGAGIIVMALSALTVLFNEKERPKAVGIWAAANFLALPIGPILGGWLLSHYWWGWVFLINVPVAIVGLIAIFALLPESRAPERPRLDTIGLAVWVAGLIAITYGIIEAGQDGWDSVSALAFMALGLVALCGFFIWERHVVRKPDGQPLIDPVLFDSASYTWGVILAAVAVLAMMGVLFTMPQYFQGVLGANPMSSGLRLVPLVGGLILGALPADKVVRVVGAKITAACGFFLLAMGMLIGATTSMHSGGGFVAAWMVIVGAGMGLAMATTTSAALSELPEDRSGIGSAVLQSVNKVGAPFGVAILGSMLSSAYLAHLNLSALPASAITAIRRSVFGGVAVAQRMDSVALLTSVRTSFVYGMDLSLVVSAGVAIAGAILAVVFLPASSATDTNERKSVEEVTDFVAAS